MYNFKEFFNKNYDFTIFLEAYRGSYSKKPVLYDEEDLDFLYQIDQKYWIEALKARYMKCWELLKNRKRSRSIVIREMLPAVKQSKFFESVETNGKKQRKFLIDSSNIEEFKQFLLNLGDKYDSYGDNVEITDPDEIKKRRKYIDNLFKEYDIKNVSTRRAIDNQRTIRDLIFEVVKRIVIYVKGGDDEKYNVSGKSVNFYVNRLIQKLETTIGEKHHLKGNLENLSKVYGRDVKFEKYGKYGFDLSSPQKIKSTYDGKKTTLYGAGSVKDGRIFGYVFPKEQSIKDSLNRLLVLNYQRHLPNISGGPGLPSDEPDHLHDIRYKIIRSSRGKVERFSDKITFDSYKLNFKNQITKFIDNHENLSWNSDKLKEILEGSINPDKELEEMISGIWFVKSILGDRANREDISNNKVKSKLKSIFHNNYEYEVERFKENDKIGLEVLNNITRYENIRKNRKLKDMFSEYFAKVRATDAVKSQVQGLTPMYGPKILGYINTGNSEKDIEIRKKEISLLDEKDREELKSILGEDGWEKFIKTGRLPYGIDEKNKKILVGGEDPPVILPHVTIGSGQEAMSFPLLNPGSYLSQLGVLDPKIERMIDSIKLKLSKKIEKYEDLKSLDLDNLDDLEKLKIELERKSKSNLIGLVDKLINNLKSKEIAERSKVTTSRSSSIINKDGEPIDQVVKYYRTKDYRHGKKGTILPGQRPVSGGSSPSAPSRLESRLGYYKIFPVGSTVVGTNPSSSNPTILIDDKIWASLNKTFEENPELKPDKVRPMIKQSYRITSSTRNYEESIDLSKFIIIKEDIEEDSSEEESEERSAEGAKKSNTRKYNSSGKQWIEIIPVKKGEEAADITGWSDIIEGIKNALLGGAFGSYEGEEFVKKYLLEPENLEKLHDDIVYEFYHNSTDQSLHTSAGRRVEAASLVGIMLQSKFKGAIARKKRTGVSSKINTKSDKSIAGINIKDFSSINKEFYKDIFIDFKDYQQFKLSNGKAYVPRLVRSPGKPMSGFSFRGYREYSPENDENIEDQINRFSQILSLDLDQVKIDNYNEILEFLNNEKQNLINYWNEIFPKIKSAIESQLGKSEGISIKDISELNNYLYKSDLESRNRVSLIYDNKIKQVSLKYKEFISQIPVDKKDAVELESVVRKGINDLSDVIQDVNKTLKDFGIKLSTERIPLSKGEAAPVKWNPRFQHQELPIKYEVKLPPIVNWFNMIISLLRYLGHSINHDQQNLKQSLLKFIGIQKGGLSLLRPNDLKSGVHLFFDKIDDNIKKFIEISTKNLDELNISEKDKNTIRTNAPKLEGIIRNQKQNLISILSRK